MKEKEYEFIFKEIDASWNYINNRRNSAVNFFKIYISLVVILGGYISFVNAKIENQTGDFFVYGYFGLFFTIVIFMTGWGLLDTVTRITAGTIKQYKHLIGMRNLISDNFTDEIKFSDYSINIHNNERIPIKVSRHIPILGAGFNFLVSLLSYYFLNIIFNGNNNYSISVMSLLLLFAILFYSNVIDKHYEELVIAQRTSSKRDEISSRKIVEKYVKYIKKQKRYSIAYKSLVLISTIFLINTIFISFYHYTDFKYLLLIQILLVLIITALRLLIGKNRVERLQCKVVISRT